MLGLLQSCAMSSRKWIRGHTLTTHHLRDSGRLQAYEWNNHCLNSSILICHTLKSELLVITLVPKHAIPLAGTPAVFKKYPVHRRKHFPAQWDRYSCMSDQAWPILFWMKARDLFLKWIIYCRMHRFHFLDRPGCVERCCVFFLITAVHRAARGRVGQDLGRTSA